MQGSLGVARNVLSARLQRLIDEDILERRAYQESPPRYEYFLTEKGLDLWPALIALLRWGDRHSAGPEGPPMLIVHKECGGPVTDRGICERCGEVLEARDAPGAVPGPGLRRPPSALVGPPAASFPRRRAPLLVGDHDVLLDHQLVLGPIGRPLHRDQVVDRGDPHRDARDLLLRRVGAQLLVVAIPSTSPRTSKSPRRRDEGEVGAVFDRPRVEQERQVCGRPASARRSPSAPRPGADVRSVARVGDVEVVSSDRWSRARSPPCRRSGRSRPVSHQRPSSSRGRAPSAEVDDRSCRRLPRGRWGFRDHLIGEAMP